ncbi:ATP-grasp domain-containing protein [Amycolatopsis sp. NPDC004079]|uniref:ATP-grasp domain-containing protein n=1 Tax=Amycolatopsis sp. NPDC004079 TaxID=3154549 RepID=UPI0033B8B4AD
MTARPRIGIVDAYSSAHRLAPGFHAAGFDVVHVQSTPTIPQVYRASFRREDFVDNVVHDGDMKQLLRQLKKHEPTHVIAGIESGVELSDQLSERLGLRTNGTALSAARRDKFRMIESVRAAGLRTAQQIRTSDEQELAMWHESVGDRIVVKPLKSAGNDGVFFCDTPEQAGAALRSIIGANSALSARNDAVVAQEYLYGTEFYVNTVSLDGKHRVCDIWRTSHISANGVLDLLEGSYLLPRRGPVQDELVTYALGVLDALGIQNGPAHMEVKQTPHGPALIEVGARVCGGDMPHLAGQAVDGGQLEWTVDAYARPDRFLARHADDYRIARYAGCVGLVSPVRGTLRSYRGLDRVEQLDSVHQVKVFVQPGDQLVETINDFTFPASIYLLHELESVVMRDFATIRHLDGAHFYELA